MAFPQSPLAGDLDFFLFDSLMDPPPSPSVEQAPILIDKVVLSEQTTDPTAEQTAAHAILQLAARDEMVTLRNIVNELLTRMEKLESQLEAKDKKLKAIEGYLEHLEPLVARLESRKVKVQVKF